MKRVSFLIRSFDSAWLGGTNYFRSLFNAIAALKNPEIEPVLVVQSSDKQKARELFPQVSQLLEAPFLNRKSLGHYARHGLQRVFKTDVLLDGFYGKNGIDLASHANAMGRRARTPSLVWIPDFQHLHLPHLFTQADLKARDKAYRLAGTDATGIIVSSNSALQDLRSFMPEAEGRARVLNFVPALEFEGFLPLSELVRKYELPEKFIFFPGQLWSHKNHLLVLKALAILKSQGRSLKVICTGQTQDTRNPDHFAQVLKTVAEDQLEDWIRFLGVVPYSHMASLMWHCHAMLNPSLFEGWSTTVEEAKLMGKNLALSDIAVHREQAGNDGSYFDPHSPESCAEVLWSVWNSESKGMSVQVAKSKMDASVQHFGLRYQDIALEAMSKSSHKIAKSSAR